MFFSVSDSRHLRLVNCALPSNKFFFFFANQKGRSRTPRFSSSSNSQQGTLMCLIGTEAEAVFLSQHSFFFSFPSFFFLSHTHTHITSSICWQTGKNYWNGHLARTKRSPSREKAHTLTTIDSALHLNQHQQQQQQWTTAQQLEFSAICLFQLPFFN